MARVNLCVDSSVVCTLILQERGWQAILRALQRSEVSAFLPGPVLTEAIAVSRRKGNRSSPEQLGDGLHALGLHVEPCTRDDLVRAAALIGLSEANPGPRSTTTGRDATLSLGDALILATTERLGYKILTRDTYWRWMVDEGLIDLEVIVP